MSRLVILIQSEKILCDELRSVVKESGVSALIVTHDTADALSVADTLAVTKDGRLEQVGSPERFIFTPMIRICQSLW